ncbi:hypothetical protein niasHT_014261 [Heterodera trifolii]|uniref:Uncharacterized protein n=1 Tax=Heterodera trifolii TaxID=157864 RepID=A0ABD2LMN2_9BILA
MLCRNALAKDKEYTVLMKRLDEAKSRFKSRPDKITGIYLELAEYLKNSLFLADKAEQNYEKVISWGQNCSECSFDCSLAYRSLAEIAIEREDYDSAIKKISSSLDFAYKTENPGLIQQALHQRAHICMSCGLPEKALIYAKECFKYLEENGEEIDELKKDGDFKCRMAHLQNFLAAIYTEIISAGSSQRQNNYEKRAIELNERAAKYASEHGNWTLLYRTLLLKLELTTGKERVSVAQSLCNTAAKVIPTKVDEKRFKKEAKCHLSLEKLRHCEPGNFGESKTLLWKRYEELRKEPDSVSGDLFEAVEKALIFIYKTEHRMKRANSVNLKDNAMRRRAQMSIFEKIGDEASFLGMNEIALTFYQRMLKTADKADDKRKAWCSMAETARDCRLWSRALDFFKEVKALEQQLAYDEEEMIDTDIAIAIVSAEIEDIPPRERLDKFRKVYGECRTPSQKLNILGDYLAFLSANGSHCAGGEYETKLKEKAFWEKKLEEEDNSAESGGQTEMESTERDELDEMDEQQILFEIAREMKVVERNEKIVKEKANKNTYGESNLHEVARSGEYQQLKELIERGYDVNQMDHGGWTPLSEAVSAQNLANVRLLLMKGASPNTRSKEFLMDEEQNKITSSGLTPLMEACSVGNVEIGKMLIQFKARACAKDDDEWTALEYLNEFLMNTKGMDKQQEEKLRKFGDLIRHRQTEEGLSSRTFEDFLELLQQKKASQRKSSKSSQNSFTSESNGQLRRKRRISEDSENGNYSKSQLGKENRNAWISDEEDERGEEADSEETRNLKDYRRCIVGLMRKGNGQPAEGEGGSPLRTPKTPPLLFKRKEMASASKRAFSTKRLFFK